MEGLMRCSWAFLGNSAFGLPVLFSHTFYLSQKNEKEGNNYFLSCTREWMDFCVHITRASLAHETCPFCWLSLPLYHLPHYSGRVSRGASRRWRCRWAWWGLHTAPELPPHEDGHRLLPRTLRPRSLQRNMYGAGGPCRGKVIWHNLCITSVTSVLQLYLRGCLFVNSASYYL